MKTKPRLNWSTAVVAFASMFALAAYAPAVPAATVTSVATGLWNNPATWDTGVPLATDDVVIGAGTTVDINTTPLTMNSLTVNGTLEYDATLRAVTVTTNVYIAPGGILQTNPAGTQTGHTLSVGGNLTNDGTLDLSTNGNLSGARLTFTGAASNTFGGAGLTTDLRTLTINKGTSKANVLEITTAALSVQGTVVDGTPMAFLTLTNGTLKISGTFTLTGRTFTSGSYSIPANGGLWLNNPNYTVSAASGNPTLAGTGNPGAGTPGTGGLLHVSAGTLNVGTAISNSMQLGNNSTVIVEGGAINVAGRLAVNSNANNVSYTQTGGVVTVCTVGNTTAGLGSFDLGVGLGPDVVMSGGTVILRNNSTPTTLPIDYRNQQGSTANSITGTVVQFGDASSGAAKTFRVAGLLPNVVVSNASAGHTVLFTGPTNFVNSANDVTINPGCTFDIGNQTYLERGTTVTNNGTLNASGPSSRFVWFGGSSTYLGAGVSTGVLSSWETGAASLTMSQAGQLNVRRAVIFSGNILNSSTLTLGDGSATLNSVQIGNTTTPTAAGTFDAAPTFNLGTGGEQLAYLRTATSRSTSVELEPGRAPVNLTYDDNDPSHTLTIAGGNITVSGTTALTNGRVITNGSTLVANGVVTRSTGYVDGLLQKPVAMGGPVARTFEIGNAVGYSPIDVTFASVTGAGTLTGRTASGDHAQIASSGIDASKSVNRTWTLTNSGTTFTTADAAFSFTPGDIDGGANFNNFVVRKYDAPNWSAPATGARTATSTQATGITSFSDFAVGEPVTHAVVASAGTGGSIAPAGTTNVPDGSNQAYTITPDACSAIADVKVDGVSVGAVASYTFMNVQATHTIAASFSPQPVHNIDTGLCYGTIQAAIDAAATLPGHHIQVASGTYIENVNDTKGVHLLGANAGACGTGPRGPESVIDGNFFDAAVTLTTGSSLDGFKVIDGLDGGNAGVVMPAASSGVSVVNNIITENTIGIYANSNGASLIDCNLITANNLPGPAGGSGIYSENSKDLTVSHNEFTGHTDNNPTIFAATAAGAHTGLTVTANNYHDTYGIYCVSVSGTFSGNTISTSAAATSLAFGGACVGDTVIDNYFNGQPRGVRIEDDGYGYGDNANIKINHNQFTGNSQYAIGLVDGYTNVPVDATCNWYGTLSGPTNPANPMGAGDPVVGAVTFQPWLDGSIAGSPSCSEFVNGHGIVATAGPGGSITPPGTTVVSSGSNQVYTITPNSCYSITDVKVDGSSVGAVSTYTFTNVQAGHTIAATFAPGIALTASHVDATCANEPAGSIDLSVAGGAKPYTYLWSNSATSQDIAGLVAGDYTVTVTDSLGCSASLTTTIGVAGHSTISASKQNNGTIVPSGDTEVACGNDQTFTFTPDPGFAIVAVVVDNTTDLGPVTSYTFTGVTKNHRIMVVFGPPTAGAQNDLPKVFGLSEALPNPSKGDAAFTFSVPKTAEVRLSILDVTGRVVDVLASGTQAPGRYTVKWGGRASTAAGMYFIRFEAGGQRFTRRLIIRQ